MSQKREPKPSELPPHLVDDREELHRVLAFQERAMAEMELRLLEQEAQLNDQARTIAEHLKTITTYEEEFQRLRAEISAIAQGEAKTEPTTESSSLWRQVFRR